MKTKTIVTEDIEVDIVGGYGGDPMRIANGSPIKTSNFLDTIVGTIRRMELELDEHDFDLSIWFGEHGVTVIGETK